MGRVSWCLLLLLFGCEKDAIFRNPNPPPPPPPVMMMEPDAGTTTPPVDAGNPVTDAGVPVAREPVYIHTGDTLYSYDPVQNRALRIGEFVADEGPIENMVDTAIDRDGTMYGGVSVWRNDAFENRVFLIDPDTGRCTFLFEFDDILHGMAFLDDGRLVIAGERVTVIDPQSGAPLLTWPSTDQFVTSGDVVGLPDGMLYWTVEAESGNGPDRVVRINPETGQTTVIGDASIGGIFGLGYSEGELFGFTSRGQVVTLDPNSGTVLGVQNLEGRWFGATTNPVLWD